MSGQNPSIESLLQSFISALEAVEASVRRGSWEGRSLHQAFLMAQQLYQQKLLPALAELPATASSISYQTEINRSLRLLGMDVTFLQAAKTAATTQQRQRQMQQRLQTLIGFSRTLMEQL